MKLNNIFAEIPDELDNELMQVLQQSDNIKIQRIVSKGQVSPETGWYDQQQNEWVIVIKGEAVITFEQTEVAMQAGSYINIPAHTRHKVSWTHPDLETVWLVVYF